MSSNGLKRNAPDDYPATGDWETDVPLSPSQQAAFDRAMAGESLFITGPAGTGKSALLRQLSAALEQRYDVGDDAKHVYVSSSTGISASLVSGVTLHSILKAGLVRDAAEIVKSAWNNRAFWENCQVLIIDEISMLNDFMFDGIDGAARKVRFRSKNQMFGGIQVILFGDLAQLPPVTGDSVVHAKVWDHFSKHTALLTDVFRQNDDTFVDLLHRVRLGNQTRADIERINTRYVESCGDDVPRLYTRNIDVREYNEKKLDALPGPDYSYTADDRFAVVKARANKRTKTDDDEVPSTVRDKLRKNVRVAETIRLRVGARVLLLININVAAGLVNGSSGEVIEADSTGVRVRFDSGPVMRLERMRFEAREVVGAREMMMARMQVPLTLGWATTVHKSQGMSLDRAAIDLARVWGVALGYVSLSRLRSLDALYMLSHVDDTTFVANQEACEFYAALQEAVKP